MRAKHKWLKCSINCLMFIVEDPYMLSGFMALQMAIEKSFVEMWTNPMLPRIADNVKTSNNEIIIEST